MEELRHGTEEMSQYIVTLANGKQIRMFISAEDYKTEHEFMIGCLNPMIQEVTRYSTETVTVE